MQVQWVPAIIPGRHQTLGLSAGTYMVGMMTSVLVMGSCLANLPCVYLMSDYRWERPNNAAVLRSDYFVDKFLDGRGYLPSPEEFLARVRFKPNLEAEGLRWLRECYRDTVGHLEIPLDKPGLF